MSLCLSIFVDYEFFRLTGQSSLVVPESTGGSIPFPIYSIKSCHEIKKIVAKITLKI